MIFDGGGVELGLPLYLPKVKVKLGLRLYSPKVKKIKILDCREDGGRGFPSLNFQRIFKLGGQSDSSFQLVCSTFGRVFF